MKAVDIIIGYLNLKANKRFKSSAKTNQSLIEEQLNKGFKVMDFKKVIDLKVNQWLNVPSMKPYLKPTTLFAKHNFQNYLKEANIFFNNKTLSNERHYRIYKRS